MKFLRMAVCTGVLGVSTAAFADPIATTSLFFNMQGTVCAPQCGRPLNTTLSFTTNNAPTSDPLEVLLGGAGNGALVSGSSDFGHAQLVAETDALAQGPGSGNLDAVSHAEWTDYFTINGGLAPGTVVQVMASMVMDGIADATAGNIGPDGTNPNRTSSFWSFFAQMSNLIMPGESASICAESLDLGCFLPPNVPFETDHAVIFDMVVGEINPVFAYMQATAGAAAAAFVEGEVSNASVRAEASHSARFYLQPLGDFTLVSASGHDYSPSAAPAPPEVVPEPASMLLVATGLAGLARARRRHRGARC